VPDPSPTTPLQWDAYNVAAVAEETKDGMGRYPWEPGRARVVGLLLVCLLAVGGCGIVVERGGGDGGASPPSGDVDELRDDVDTAVRSTDRFWSEHWSELFSGRYVSPRVHGFYDGDNPSAGPFCGSQPPVPLNAFYCPAEDLLAWDENLMTMLFEEGGDASVYLVVAHEWGHAVQQRLSEELVTVDAELQADCLAGASLFGSARDGVIRFEQGDQEELARVLAALSDRTPWTNVGDHGSASQRVDAFARGGRGGIEACLPSR
jgi:predicted metalloprotease